MASSAQVRAGRAFVEFFLEDGPLQRGLKKVEAKVRRTGAQIANVGKRAFALGGALATPFIAGIKAAADMQETMNKFNVVFGDNAEAMKQWGDNFANQVGRSKAEIAGFLASSQDLLVPLGFENDEAENLSKQLTELAVDLASFNNMADADVLRDLQAAMTGSGEVMKKYGVIVSEAAVKQELLNQGLDPKEATEQQKAFARLQIILKGTTAAQGDAIRSSDSFTNQMKRLKGILADTAVALGEKLLPIVTPYVEKVNEAVSAVGEWIGKNDGAVKTIAAVSVALIAGGTALVAIGTSLKVAAAAMGAYTTATVIATKVVGLYRAANAAASAGLLTKMVPSLWAYVTGATAAKFATIALKAGLFALASYGIYRVASAIYRANGSIKDFNDQLQKMKGLAQESNSRFERLQANTLKTADRLSGGARVKYLEEQLARAERELGGAKASLKGQQKLVDGLDTAFNRTTGNKILEAEKQALTDQTARVDSLSQFSQQLRDALDDAKYEAENASLLGPQTGGGKSPEAAVVHLLAESRKQALEAVQTPAAIATRSAEVSKVVDAAFDLKPNESTVAAIENQTKQIVGKIQEQINNDKKTPTIKAAKA